jgi:large subunit ribosomal protein L2
MILVKCKPITPGSRHKRKLVSVVSAECNKHFKINKNRQSGRNSSTGILLCKRKSPKLKKHMNANPLLFNISHLGLISSVEFFFKKKPLFGLVKYSNGAYSCIKLANGLIPGSFVKSTNISPYYCGGFFIGDTVLIEWLYSRSVFFNVISNEKKKSVYANSSGTFCTIFNSDEQKGYTKIELPSGVVKYVYNFSFVTLGRNSNMFRNKYVVGKAGDNAVIGRRSSVRGIAMNPVDHPHGGRAKTNSPEKLSLIHIWRCRRSG